jgi:hypothetical protein
MSAENDDERTPAAGPADAGQQAGGSNCGSGSSRPSGRMGQRPRRDRNNRGPARPTESAPRGKKFTGRCKELMGEICDCSAHNQVDCCTKTTKEVAENVGRTCSSDTRTAAETLILPTFDCPSDPATGARETEKRKWTKRVDTMVCREDRFDEDPKKVHSLIWGQCTELLRAKLQAMDGCDQMKAECDTVELSKSIKDCVFKFSDQKKAAHSPHEALRKFCNGHQEKSSNAQDHHQRFKNHVEVAEHCGGSPVNHQGLIDKKLEERGLSMTTCLVNDHREAITDSKEEHLACTFLLGSDRKRHGKLIEDLENDHVQRNDKHPKTLVEACNLLIHWKQDPKNPMIGSPTSDGMAFANVGGEQRPPQDSENGKQFIVHKENGMVRRFRQSEDGLFHMDAKESDEEQDGTVLVNKVESVEGNKKNCTKAACKQATLTRKLQNISGRLLARSFLNIEKKNLLKDCPVTRENVLAAEDIFGPEIERHVRTIKERTRCVCDAVPFKTMPARMTIEMAHASVFWLYMFPALDGVSGDLSSE